MKKTIALLFSLFLCSILTVTAQAYNISSFIFNETCYLTDDHKLILSDLALEFAETTKYNIMVEIADDIGEDKTPEGVKKYAEMRYNEVCPDNPNGIYIVISLDARYWWIYTCGEASACYTNERLSTSAEFTDIYFEEYDYYTGLYVLIRELIYNYEAGIPESNDLPYTADNTLTNYTPPRYTGNSLLTEEATESTDVADSTDITDSTDDSSEAVAKATNGAIAKIFDDYDYLTSYEEGVILDKAKDYAQITGFNIIFVISDDIGSDKSDNGVMAYADDVYDETCGINTDGILLLINNDTKYDWISTSGACINYYSDYRIELLFDAIYDDIVDGYYGDACLGFVNAALKHYNAGKANNQVGLDFGGSTHIELDLDVVVTAIFPIGVMTLIVSIILYNCLASPYKLKKATTNRYVMQNSLRLSCNVDESKGYVTTRTYSPRSSGSSGRSGGGRSSTHRSRSGGRHGGGGRRR